MIDLPNPADWICVQAEADEIGLSMNDNFSCMVLADSLSDDGESLLQPRSCCQAVSCISHNIIRDSRN